MSARLRTLTPEDRGLLAAATPEQRSAMLREAGFNEDEILEHDRILQERGRNYARPGTPR